MPPKKLPKETPALSAEPLYREIRAVLESARLGAYRAVNAAMVQAYWQVGRLIVEHEQDGRKRAAYGEAVLEDLSRRLTAEFGRGFDERNLRYMRQFYRVFPMGADLISEIPSESKRNAPRSESRSFRKRNALRSELANHPSAGNEHLGGIPAALGFGLSWTHFRLLLGVGDPAAREWLTREIQRERRLIEAHRSEQE